MKNLHRSFGLGDLAYYCFKPAVWLIDLVWGTDLHSCERCAERRQKWNGLFAVPRWSAIVAGALLAVLTITIILNK
jgi:hypothetical protein